MKNMVLRAFSFLATLCLFTAFPSAADTNPPPRLTVELRDGSRVVGESVDKEFKFRSALLGEIKLPVKDLRAVDFTATNTTKLTTINGDLLTAVLLDRAVPIKTSFGKVDLAVSSLRKLSVITHNAATTYPTGLVALWAGEGSGRDSIGDRELNLTDITFTEGKVGQAFVMNGYSSCMNLAGPADFDPSAGAGLTLSAWIKPNNVTSFHPIVEWNPSDTMPGVIGVQLWIGNRPESEGVLAAHFVSADGRAHSLISPLGTVTTGKFQHVAATYDKETGVGVLFLNGAVVARNEWESFTPLTKGSFWVSRRPTDHPGDWTYNTFFSGLLDEISVYDRALSVDEIQSVVGYSK